MLRQRLLTIGLAAVWTIVVIGTVFVHGRWLWHPNIARGDTAAIERHLTRSLEQAVADGKIGSAALVLMERGQIVTERGFGVAHAEAQEPFKPDRTLYQLASVSKTVTAWGVMKLVQDGKIRLDEPVLPHLRRWRFPGSGSYADGVTVRHLLSHTAGLDDGLGYGGFLAGETPQTLENSLSDAKDSTVGRPRAVVVVREPGRAISYSGGGYTVLQLLVEELTKRPFAEYMADAVLTPLGMNKATFDIDDLAAEDRARDLATAYDLKVKPQPHRRHTAKASVALLASARDMAHFLRANVVNNPVLRPHTLDQMLRPQPGTSGTWGLGYTLFAATDSDDYVVGHDGGSPPAWGAMLRLNRATGNGMVLMVSGGSGAVNQLGHDWVYWETGIVTSAARRQILYDRVGPALVVVVLGVIAIVLFVKRRLTLA
ncbi:MAG TPA: serine hydrolase domain-containing protein [Thermoanaerobaculia bacterium]|nr:serine hydrolase domain-containing protein [Thermoanaerobaculia bacterium]